MRFFLSVFAMTLLVSACGSGDLNCNPTPVGPSCVNGPVDKNNPLPGPGGGVRASATFAIYEGDCPDNPASCAGQLSPTDDPTLRVLDREMTFIVKNHTQKYTARVCVTHPGVPGRKLMIRVQAGYRGTVVSFDEAEPDKRSPVCVSHVFDMSIPGGYSNEHGGQGEFVESNQDLSTTDEGNTVGKQMWGFRVKP